MWLVRDHVDIDVEQFLAEAAEGRRMLAAGDREKARMLLGNAAAREEALVLARELKDGKVLPGRSWDGWFVQIVDQHGHEVDTVPFDAVPV